MSHRIDRREALRRSALGVALMASSGWLAACARGEQRVEQQGTDATAMVLSTDDVNLVDAIADTLLPTTAASPGASAARVGATINLLLTDCYAEDDQRRATQGLAAFRRACRERYGANFASLPRAQREDLLRSVAAEAQKLGGTHYFHLLRDVAQRAYFSSEIGMTRALRYIQVPGHYVGCVPLTPGQPAWG